MKRLLIGVTAVGVLSVTGQQVMAQTSGVATTSQVALRATYSQPATNWEEEALPLGNGYMGAMVFGDVFNEVVQTNEKTIWSGGPGEDANYDGGHKHSKASVHSALKDFRRTLQDNMTAFSAAHAPGSLANYPGNDNYYDSKGSFGDYDGSGKYLNALLGTKDHFGSYQTLGEIHLDDTGFPSIVTESIWTNYDNNVGSSEVIKSAFDGNTSTKWFSEKHDGRTFPVDITWEYTKAPEVRGYYIGSGNDMPVRDPKSWTLYGSADGKNFRLLATLDNPEQDPAQTNGAYLHEINFDPVSLKAIRLVVTPCEPSGIWKRILFVDEIQAR